MNKKIIFSLFFIIVMISMTLLIVNALSNSTETADAGILTGTYTGSGGSYVSTQADDTTYYYVGSGSNNANISAYIELNFSLSSLGIFEKAINAFNISAIYCHDGTSTGAACTGTAAEGTYNGNQSVEIYNFTGSNWYGLGNLLNTTGGNTVQSNFTLGSGIYDFVDDNTNIVRTRFKFNFTVGSAGNADAFFDLDYVTLRLDYYARPNVTSLNNPLNNSYFNTNTLNFNFTVVSNELGFTNATIYGNWVNGWHGNRTIYSTSINNGTSTNVTIIGIPDGRYVWNVLVYDDYSAVNQSAWFSENYTFVVDTINPGFVLNSPTNDTISLNTSTMLNITVTDNREEIIARIYGGTDFDFYNNNSLLYKRTGLSNNTEIVYNWTSPVLNVTSETRLLMHFDLEGADNATFVSDETGLNNGTKLTSNAPVWNESGKFAYSLGFDGVDDTVTVSDSNSLDLNESFSISFWVYPTSLSSNMTFLSKGSGISGTNYYIDYKTNNKIEFGFYNGAFRSLLVDASSISSSRWSLITATLNDTSNISRVYVNGEEKGSLQLDYDVPANAFDLKIGSFPGFTQNFTGLIDELVIFNKTLSASEITNIYQLSNGTWYWRADLNDTSSNINISQTRMFKVGSIWEVFPTSFGSVGTTLSTNVSIGTLLINNTHAYHDVSVNITSDYSGIVIYNISMPFNLTGSEGNWTRVQINVTSPATEGSTTINFNVTATDYTGASSIPSSIIVPLTLVASSGNPFLITAFETVPTTVSQNNTGISLIASVINRGQGNAQNAIVQFQLPNGWSNSSGALNQSLGIVLVNEQKNASIIININSSATTGIVTLYANVTGQNATGSDISASLKTIGSANVTVNEVSAGTGPGTTSSTTTTINNGGGGGSSAGAGSGVVYSKTLELVRGKTNTFQITVDNKYSNRTLEDLTLNITGYLAQYIKVSPSRIDRIVGDSKGIFTITLEAPKYIGYGQNTLTLVINGYSIIDDNRQSYKQTQYIKLILQEIDKNETLSLLDGARKAVEYMKSKGFYTLDVEKLLELANAKLLEEKNGEVAELAGNILSVKNKSDKAYDLISIVRTMIDNPKKSLISGNVVKNPFTGKVVFSSDSVQEFLDLAVVAFGRGDYDLAYERASNARNLLALERKGSILLFFYLYWPFVLVSIVLLSVFAIVGTRGYRKTSVINGIKDLDNEEDNIRELLIKNQKRYFEKKQSAVQYHALMNGYQERIANIKKERLLMRNKRIKLLAPEKIMPEIERERKDAESEIKKIQQMHYNEGKLSKDEYMMQFGILNERIAEIEEEKIALELMHSKAGENE